MLKMRRLIAVAILAGASLGSLPAAALSEASQNFVNEAISRQRFEMLSAQMVPKKSQNEQLIAFSRQMEADYAAALDEMSDGNSDVEALINEQTMDTTHRQMLDKLFAYSGETFDKLYIGIQDPEHMQLVKLFEGYAVQGDDEDLKLWAGQRVAALRQNLEHARRLQLAMPHD